MTKRELAKAAELNRFWRRGLLSGQTLNVIITSIRQAAEPKGLIFSSEEARGEYVATYAAALVKHSRRGRQ